MFLFRVITILISVAFPNPFKIYFSPCYDALRRNVVFGAPRQIFEGTCLSNSSHAERGNEKNLSHPAHNNSSLSLTLLHRML